MNLDKSEREDRVWIGAWVTTYTAHWPCLILCTGSVSLYSAKSQERNGQDVHQGRFPNQTTRRSQKRDALMGTYVRSVLAVSVLVLCLTEKYFIFTYSYSLIYTLSLRSLFIYSLPPSTILRSLYEVLRIYSLYTPI